MGISLDARERCLIWAVLVSDNRYEIDSSCVRFPCLYFFFNHMHLVELSHCCGSAERP